MTSLAWLWPLGPENQIGFAIFGLVSHTKITQFVSYGGPAQEAVFPQHPASSDNLV
jgi:hypothetical protein